jgi:hypothetical protein
VVQQFHRHCYSRQHGCCKRHCRRHSNYQLYCFRLQAHRYRYGKRTSRYHFGHTFSVCGCHNFVVISYRRWHVVQQLHWYCNSWQHGYC